MREEAERIFELGTPSEIAELQRFSPAEHLDSLATDIFILHDQGDHCALCPSPG